MVALLVFVIVSAVLIGRVTKQPNTDVDSYLLDRKAPQPTGVAAYGVARAGNSVISYTITTDALLGEANISSISAEDGASLQLNGILVIQNNNGSRLLLVAQNTVTLVTNLTGLDYHDSLSNVYGGKFGFNVSGRGGNSIGFVKAGSAHLSGEYYNYGTLPQRYSLPLTLRLSMNVTTVKGEEVDFDMTANALHYDLVKITDHDVGGAYFIVSGSAPIVEEHGVTLYDAELVFGGMSLGAATHFQAMNASLLLTYYNATQHTFNRFPSYFSFGSITGEGTDNLHVSPSGDIFMVTTGTPDYAYLESASNSSP